MWSGILYFALVCYVAATSFSATPKPETYRAGIVEVKPPPKGETKLETLLNNAKLYGKYAAEAAEMGVQILVFSEYGLVTLYDLKDSNRENIAGYLQDVPDPTLQEWNPCLDPDKFSNTQVLHELSCAARKNSLVIVANLLSREPCDPEKRQEQSASPSKCPQDGYYHFNTNVFFAQNGTLLARYHKSHLFTEEAFADPVPRPEYVIVDLGFVRIATIVCFDIMWASPLTELVEKHGIRNLAYPTAWVNELPYYTAPQVFASIAYGLGINILAANYFSPELGAVGSGIFSSTRGLLNGTWDVSMPGQLLIADVPVDPSMDTTDDSLTCDVMKPVGEDVPAEPPVGIPPHIFTEIPTTKHTSSALHRIVYDPLINIKYAKMDGMQGDITQLCQGSLCCDLSYEFATRDTHDSYIFVARSGVRTILGGYKLGIQICSVLRCERVDDLQTCGRVPDPRDTSETCARDSDAGCTSDTRFDRLIITGKFNTKYLFPNVFSTKLDLVKTDSWSFVKRECSDDSENGISHTVGTLNITSAAGKDSSILSAAITARVYKWDV